MKIIATSDLHGDLPEIPECDLLLIAGDLCRDGSIFLQRQWLDQPFRTWLENVPAKKIVGIAGNHDWIFQIAPELVPDLPWTYLQDGLCEYEGLKIWGTPWSKLFWDWAFMLPEAELVRKWSLIPDDVDIIVVHGPPKYYGDKVDRLVSKRGEEPKVYEIEHTGSISLKERILEIKPKLVVFGHIHCDSGQWKVGDTTLANVTLVNDQRESVYPPKMFEVGNEEM